MMWQLVNNELERKTGTSQTKQTKEQKQGRKQPWSYKDTILTFAGLTEGSNESLSESSAPCEIYAIYILNTIPELNKVAMPLWRYYPSICLEYLRKTMTNLSKNIWWPSPDFNQAPLKCNYRAFPLHHPLRSSNYNSTYVTLIIEE